MARLVVGLVGKSLLIMLTIIHAAIESTGPMRQHPRRAKIYTFAAKNLLGRRGAAKGSIVAILPRAWRAARGSMCAARPWREQLAARPYAHCVEQSGENLRESATEGPTG